MTVALRSAKRINSRKRNHIRAAGTVLLSFIAGCGGGSTMNGDRGGDKGEGEGERQGSRSICESVETSSYFTLYRGGEARIDSEYIMEVLNAEIMNEGVLRGRVTLRAVDNNRETMNTPGRNGEGFHVRTEGSNPLELESSPTKLMVEACAVREEPDGMVAEIAVDRPIDGTTFCTPNRALYDDIPNHPPGTTTSGNLLFDLGDGSILEMQYGNPILKRDHLPIYPFTFSVGNDRVTHWMGEYALQAYASAVIPISFGERNYTVKITITIQGSYSMPISIHLCD